MAGLRDVRGRVAVVTGASSGIGSEIARELGRRGARVALVARRRERLDEVRAEIERAGGAASVHVCDVADAASVSAAASEVEAACGGVELLVNNAGYGRHTLFDDHDVDDIAHMMATNYMGTVRWIKAVLPGMKARGEGWIVNVASFAGKIGQADEVAYSASKFAVTGLSQGLAQELAPLGIHVLCLHPTLVESEMFTPEVVARMPKSTKGSFITPAKFVDRALRALARGRHEAMIPGTMRGVVILQSLFPEAMGRQIGKVKMAALPQRD